MAQAPTAPPPDVAFDRAMAEKLCATEVAADNLDGRVECLDYQLRGRRLWILFAASKGVDAKADRDACSGRWTEDGITDWQMASSCVAEAGEPLAAMMGKRDFDEKGLRTLCAEEQVAGAPSPRGANGRDPVEECLFNNAVDYRIFHMLESAYRNAIGNSFRRCRSHWTEGGVINWRMAEHCAQLEIRARERLADWR